MTRASREARRGTSRNDLQENINEHLKVCSKAFQADATSTRTTRMTLLSHSVLSVAGTPWSWGWNAHGQLGHGDSRSKSSPTQIKGIEVRSTAPIALSHTVSCTVANPHRVSPRAMPL